MFSKPQSGFGGWADEKIKTPRQADPNIEPKEISSTTFDNSSTFTKTEPNLLTESQTISPLSLMRDTSKTQKKPVPGYCAYLHQHQTLSSIEDRGLTDNFKSSGQYPIANLLGIDRMNLAIVAQSRRTVERYAKRFGLKRRHLPVTLKTLSHRQ